MKKVLAFVMAAMLAVSLAACAGGGVSKDPDLTLEEMMTAALEGVELPKIQNIEITDENFEMYFFTKPAEGAEALVSEAMISSIAHSVGIIKTADEASAGTLAASIRENLNPRKWICVEAEKSEVVVHGRYILMVMSSTDAASAISENFNSLFKE